MVSGKIGQARDKEGSVSFQNSLRGDRLLVLVDTLRVRYRQDTGGDCGYGPGED